MVTGKKTFFTLLAFLLFFSNFSAFAEISENKTKENNFFLHQELAWNEEGDSDFVLNYIVIIEEKKGSSYTQVRRLETADNTPHVSITPLLNSGSYRYKVLTCNLLGLAEAESQWLEFTIYEAHKPSVTSVLSAEGKNEIFLDQGFDGKLYVKGDSLLPSKGENANAFTEYFLVSKDGKTELPLWLAEYSEEGPLLLYVDVNLIKKGDYYVLARDASGFESPLTPSSMISFSLKNSADFRIFAAWNFPFDVSKVYYPLSVKSGCDFVFFKKSFIHTGLSSDFTAIVAKKEGILSLVSFNAFCLYPFEIKMNDRLLKIETGFHAGAGLSLFSPFNHSEKYSPGLECNLGLDSNLFFGEHFFACGKIDFVWAHIDDNLVGIIIPSLGAGFKF